MSHLETGLLPDALHEKMLEWQRRHFGEYAFLMEHWREFYPHEEAFRLIAKLGDLRSESIEIGKFKGRKRFHTAGEMDEEMITRAAKIIKAQCSTELGSIQQHRGSLSKAQDPKIQFDVLRVMAEELRHAYQMMYILASDDWGPMGKDLAFQLIEELLSMRTGTQVLDAFNLFFDSFVDNIVFCAVIDRVGKYQLQMQQTFSYAPMARSMLPMLREEAFHLRTGVEPLKGWARDPNGNVAIDNIQRHINKWFPRGLEMFGNEKGGQEALEFAFKDLSNAEAMGRYYRECKQDVVDVVNAEIVRVKHASMARDEAVRLADRVVSTGAQEAGFAREDFLFLPSERWFRRRGMHAFESNDVDGKPIEAYESYLKRHLPESYVTGPDFKVYLDNLHKARSTGTKVDEKPLPFYG